MFNKITMMAKRLGLSKDMLREMRKDYDDATLYNELIYRYGVMRDMRKGTGPLKPSRNA